jgi:hypothetical protein
MPDRGPSESQQFGAKGQNWQFAASGKSLLSASLKPRTRSPCGCTIEHLFDLTNSGEQTKLCEEHAFYGQYDLVEG